MMGFSNPGACSSITSWERAEKHFDATPQPKRSEWEPNERPLDNARKHHYRLVRDEDDGSFYDVYLYRTPMARYYKPDGDTRVVAYNFDSRPTSSQFMWHVTDSGRRKLFETTDGRKLYVPICKGGHCEFGTTLTLVDGKLDVSRSRHRTIGTYVMSDEKKTWLKQARVFMRPFFDLMATRIPEIRAEVEQAHINRYRGRPGYGTSFHATLFRDAGIDNVPFDFDKVAVASLVTMYETKVKSVLEGGVWRREEVTNEQIAKRAATNLTSDMAKLHPGKDTQFKPLPQFPDDLPVRFDEA